MTLTKIAAISATAALLTTSALAQSTDAVLDGIISDLQSAGYSQIEVEQTADGYEIEAVGATDEVERTYDAAGTLLSEETEPLDEDEDEDDEDDDDDND